MKAYLLRETESEDGRGFKDIGIALCKEDAISWKNEIEESFYHYRNFIEFEIYRPERSKREDVNRKEALETNPFIRESRECFIDDAVL